MRDTRLPVKAQFPMAPRAPAWHEAHRPVTPLPRILMYLQYVVNLVSSAGESSAFVNFVSVVARYVVGGEPWNVTLRRLTPHASPPLARLARVAWLASQDPPLFWADFNVNKTLTVMALEGFTIRFLEIMSSLTPSEARPFGVTGHAQHVCISSFGSNE